MNLFWGILMVFIGLFFTVNGILRSNLLIYRFLVSRSRLLWGEGNAVHNFYIVAGILIMVFGILFFTGIFGK